MTDPQTQFWVYVLENERGKFHIGSTDDPERRLSEHNSALGAQTFTHKNGPWRLVWKESHASRASAMLRESKIKAMKSSKWIRDTLVNGRVPASQD